MGGCSTHPPTLVEVLRTRAAASDGRGYVFLADGERHEIRLAFTELHARARGIAAELERHQLAGQRALLLYPPGLDYICGFFGALAGSVTAVPAYPPDVTRLERSLRRLEAIIADAGPVVALTTRAVRRALEAAFGLAPGLARLRFIETDTIERLADGPDTAHIEPEQLAFLQYTSGSTGTPKGVALSHRNLLHNSARIQTAFGTTVDSRGLVWLPPYHDMGLIGGIIQPLHGGFDVVLMSPLHFLQRPMRWLEAVSRYRATVSGGPNFAYDLCVRKSTPDQRASLDLSTWDVAFNGAEPVRAETLESFADAFAVAGFRREAAYPCYGLAESTLIATGGCRTQRPVVLRTRREALVAGHIVPHAHGDVALVGSGSAFADGPLAIVDPERREPCADGDVGEIWLAGPSVASGYFGRPSETTEAFAARLASGEGPFLRTGDLGFVRDGELFVTGRLKDLVIVRGKNHHPTDLEHTAEHRHPQLRPGCSAAFQLAAEQGARVVLVAELSGEAERTGDFDAIGRSIRGAIAAEHELGVHTVVFVRARSVPKTSSGKIERHACRTAFLDGSLAEVGRHELGKANASATAELAAAVSTPPHAPRGDLQVKLCELLGVTSAELAPAVTLTALGLDSLMAMELEAWLDDRGARAPAVWLLGGATLADVAARCEHARTLAASPSHALESASASAEPASQYPLSIGQRALWFHQLLAPASAAYKLWIAGGVDGRADADALRAACQRLVDRHPSLRAVVTLVDGVPVQRVAPRAVDFEVVETPGFSQSELRALMTSEAHRPFDLADGVCRIRLYRGDADDALLLVAHHVAIDLWSAGIVLAELGSEHAPARTLPFAEHVRDETAWLARDESEATLAYWRAKLAGVLPSLELPLDRPRPGRQSFHGFASEFGLDTASTAALRELASREDTTLYTVLLAAFSAFLQRLSGQDDLLIGSPTVGRSRGFERTVGYFVNPVVVRVDVAADPSFRTLIERTRELVLEALEHATLPFPALVEQLALPRSLDRAPVFQVLFALERAHTNPELTGFLSGRGAGLEAVGLTLRPLPLTSQACAFDLTLVVVDEGERLHASLRGATALFEPETIERWADQFRYLLAALLEQPDLAISDAPLEAPAALDRCLAACRPAGGAADSETRLFHERFSAHARHAPNAPAVTIAGATLAYGELEARSNRVAARLTKLGVGPECPVAVLLDRSLDQAVAVLGVLKAGGVYVPFDPRVPDARLAFMLADTRAQVGITSGAHAGRLGDLAILRVDEPDPVPDPAVGGWEPQKLASDNAAYIIYTSGSTGRPKGVVVSHANVCNLADAQRETFGLTCDDRVLQYASPAFDAAFFELCLALTAGASLHIVPGGAVLPGPELAALVRDDAITTVTFPPAVLAALPDVPLPALRTVIAAGEVCPQAVVMRWAPGRRFFNAYGPTEATVWSTVAELGPDCEVRPAIGTSVAHVGAYVLDRSMRPSPVGVAGELYIGGASVARGYLGHPELSAASFVPDPFGPPGARLYRTGDRARWRPDGAIEFLGRVDDQVKIRGYRVEPGEIEAALTAHADVDEAAVVARPDHGGEQTLVAYVAGERAGALALESLRAHLRAHGLPEFMLPAAVVGLTGLPRTTSGKLARRELPEPLAAARPERFVAPHGELERRLLAVFSEVLGHDRIGATDHFFEVLGGSSLAVARARALLAERDQIHIEVTTLFEYPTIRALAKHLADPAAPTGRAPEHQKRAEARAAAVRRRHSRATKGPDEQGGRDP